MTLLPCFIESNRIVVGYHLTDRFREGKGICLHSWKRYRTQSHFHAALPLNSTLVTPNFAQSVTYEFMTRGITVLVVWNIACSPMKVVVVVCVCFGVGGCCSLIKSLVSASCMSLTSILLYYYCRNSFQNCMLYTPLHISLGLALVPICCCLFSLYCIFEFGRVWSICLTPLFLLVAKSVLEICHGTSI